MKKYITNCVNSTAKALDPMLEKAREINFSEFVKEIDTTELQCLFPYYDWKGNNIKSGLKFEDDWAVSYWRSFFNKKPCVYVCHSCIEYIFC
jgi:hypothetical protein